MHFAPQRIVVWDGHRGITPDRHSWLSLSERGMPARSRIAHYRARSGACSDHEILEGQEVEG